MADIICVDFKAKSRSYTRKPPPLEQVALDAVGSMTVPLCEQAERWAEKRKDESA
jgi:hypothetical protein